MKIVAMQEFQDRFNELARDAEQGELVTVTRDGKPVLDIVAHKGGTTLPAKTAARFDWKAGQEYLRAHGIEDAVPYIADDFDDPLPEDFLLKPLP